MEENSAENIETQLFLLSLKSWFTQKMTVKEAEEKHLVHDTRLGTEGVPFGFNNAEWKKLAAKMIEGDELWEFNSPPESWQHLWGRQGFALVRDGKLITIILTRMS